MRDINQMTSRYRASSRLSIMKQRFCGTNKMMSMSEYLDKKDKALSAISYKYSLNDAEKYKSMILSQVPYLESLQKINEEIEEMPDTGNPCAEDALEALVEFNTDMSTIGLNAF